MTVASNTEETGGERHSPAIESQSDTAGRGLWTAAETARWLTVPERMVRRLVAERRIPYVKVGRYVRFRPQDVKEWRDGHVRPAIVADRRHLLP
ncbi:MAG: helix-turn-helix domain-containing protein [Actinomycetota bacterium]|nr:helix-turn-helix domain-containing protein [Actinomycetota bacterium]